MGLAWATSIAGSRPGQANLSYLIKPTLNTPPHTHTKTENLYLLCIVVNVSKKINAIVK